MSRRFLRLSAVGAALTANGLRPLPGDSWFAVPSFFGGWLTSELAVHNLAITVAGSAAHVAGNRGRLDRDDRLALALNGLSVAGLAWMIRQGMQSRHDIERALTEGLSDDYVAHLDPAPTEADLATPWRHVLLPFKFHDARRVERIKDIDYAGKGHKRHLLDIYRPRESADGPLPVVVQVHGGAWIISRKEEQGLALMNHLAARNWICVAPNYPLSPRARWPEHLVALKRALAWVHENIADYGGDPSFVAVTGGSAGGHLAAMLGLTQNEPRYQPGFADSDTGVQACVPFYGVYDIANTLRSRAGSRRLDVFLSRMMFETPDPKAYDDATALLHVSGDLPPFFVIHGEHDSMVPVQEARALVRKLREVSTSPVVYAELPGAQHGFDVFHSIRSAHVIRGVERFLCWVHAHRAEAHVPAAKLTAG